MNCWCIDDWEFDDDERIIRLSIKENSYFKVLNTYFIYTADRYFGAFKLKAYVFANQKADAEKEIKHSCFFLSYIFDINIEVYKNYIHLDNSKNESDLSSSISLNSGKLKKIQSLSSRISSTTELKKESFFNCSECYLYALSLDINRLYNEEFLVLFRIFESISKLFYNDVAKHKLKHNFSERNSIDALSEYISNNFKVKVRESDLHRFQNSIIKHIKDDMLYKLLYIFEYYDIEYTYSKIEQIVKLRNDMTHMNGINISDDDLYKLIIMEIVLTRSLINKIYFDKNTFKPLMKFTVKEQ